MMDQWDISFPNLGIYLKHVPMGFSVFGFRIALYGVIIACGVLLGFMLANYECNRMGCKKDICWDFSVYAIIFSVLGGRIYYVIFSWDYYKDNLKDLFNTRQGGMAIYGAVIAGFLTLFIFCKIKKESFFKISDAGAMGLLVGQIMGRWGNFTNREVFGGYTNNLFAMRIPLAMVRQQDITPDLQAYILDGTNYVQVHPTFLYEGTLNLILLLIIFLYRKHKKFDGELALLYLGGYGIIRFWVEGIRTDQLKIGHTGIAVSQMLGIVMFAAAFLADIIIRICIKNKKQKITDIEPQNNEKSEEKAE